MKIMTIFGTRPEIIRLSLVIKVLDNHCDHVTVHTGQNYHESLSDIFIRDLGVRTPDINLGIRANSFGDQAGQILSKIDDVLSKHQPDRVLILGDTNSALSAIVCARRGIPVFHMEAGNRCYDNRVPEEVNRRIIDHSSTILLPYTNRSKENLVGEGVERERIYVTGNPIGEVLDRFSPQIEASSVMGDLNVQNKAFFLVTIHRAENVDIESRLRNIVDGIDRLTTTSKFPALVSVHPRTRDKLSAFGIEADNERIRLLDPLGFFDFVKLEKNALAVLTDSGTVQEECSIFRVPNVTVRDVTERPETLECGSNIISGAEPEAIVRSAEIAIQQDVKWSPPVEYMAKNVSQVVAKLVLGHMSLRRHIS
jgi:UDP-N-acetylglucosamine 2-epimerase (non-hydrolysing)